MLFSTLSFPVQGGQLVWFIKEHMMAYAFVGRDPQKQGQNTLYVVLRQKFKGKSCASFSSYLPLQRKNLKL
jgi:hypothetical protein